MTDDRKTRRQQFVKAADRPDAELVARQMQVALEAFKSLGSIEAARAFLNYHSNVLNGRPIDVAGLSAAGLDRVIIALKSSHLEKP